MNTDYESEGEQESDSSSDHNFLSYCVYCGEPEEDHDYVNREHLQCVPPIAQLQFGDFVIPRWYRDRLYEAKPFYTTEEIIGSFRGLNPFFESPEEMEDDDGVEYVDGVEDEDDVEDEEQ